MLFTLQLTFVLGIDLVFGDPRWLYHPVRGIGMLCEQCELYGRKLFAFLGMRLCGVIVFLMVLSATLATLFILIVIVLKINLFLATIVSLLLLYLSIAMGDLLAHSRKVDDSLTRSDLEQAREDIALLVGRETDRMTETEIARACVESVAENFVDGVAAPLFWATVSAMILFKLPGSPMIWALFGAYLYKSVNTMDSMFGYKNKRYIEFGWMAARADDFLNYLPARLGSLAIVCSAFFLSKDYKRSFLILLRDHAKSSSPNSGFPEAAVSGALRVQLGGPAVYFGEPVKGQIIGHEFSGARVDDIARANKLCLGAAFVFLFFLITMYSAWFLNIQ